MTQARQSLLTVGREAQRRLCLPLSADMPCVDESSDENVLDNDVLTVNDHVEPVGPEGTLLVRAAYQAPDLAADQAAQSRHNALPVKALRLAPRS